MTHDEEGKAPYLGEPRTRLGETPRRTARLPGSVLARRDALMATALAEEDALWSAVADPTRRRVLDALLEHGEANTTTLARGAAGDPSGRRQAPRRAEPRRPRRRPAPAGAKFATSCGPSGSTSRRVDGSRGRAVGQTSGADQAARRDRAGAKPEPIPNYEKETKMSDHRTGTREEWLAARLELLEAEKDFTRRGDELAQRRQELPWVAIEKEYGFETDEGARRSPISSTGARSCSSTTSCSGPTSRLAARPARRSRTASPARSRTWPITTSPSRRSRARRWEAAGLQAEDGLELSLGLLL